MAGRRQRTLEVNIVGDVRDLKRSLGQVEASTRSTSDKLSRAGRAISIGFGAIAGSAVLQVGADLNRLGVQAEGIRNRFSTVFGDMSDDMQQWADDVNERFGASVEAVQDMANSIQDVLVPIGFTREAAADLTREVLTTANALSEWTGGTIDAADASGRIRKALLGERESMEELGVKILQSDVNARLAAKGQAELTGEAKAQAEAMATLEIITEKSADALDAYAQGANKALVEQKALNAAVEDGRQALGDFVKREMDFAREQAGDLAGTLEDLGFILDSLSDSTDDSADSQRSWGERFAENVPALRAVTDLLGFTREKAAELRAEIEANIPPTERYGDSLGALPDHLRGTGDAGRDAAGGVDATTQSLKELQDQQRALVDPIFRLRQAEDKLNEAFEERVRLQAGGGSQSQINDAVSSELQAFQDLQFARENASGALEDGFSILERYAEELAIPTEAVRSFKEEVLGLDSALRGLPSSPFSGIGTPDNVPIRELERTLVRRNQQVVE